MTGAARGDGDGAPRETSRDWLTPRVRAGALLARRDWDVIVIGAGIGGLVAASLLAQRTNLRVLVLEQHYEPGGLTQTFRRRRFAWDVGVHYLGDLAQGTMLHRIFEVASGGRLSWARLPALHDHVLGPGLDLRFGGDADALRGQLRAAARGEERAIDRVLAEIAACLRAAPEYLRSRTAEEDERRSILRPWSDRLTAEVLADAGCSPRLTRLLTYTWTNYGVPKERSSFAAFALATAHYFGGGFYPVGGARAIAQALGTTLAARGGAVVVRAPVDEILVRDGRAHGVRLEDGLELGAPVIVSDAGARTTFERLVREPSALRDTVRAIGPSESHVGLYLGLGRSPSDLGLDGANRWLFSHAVDGADEDRASEATRWVGGERDEPPDLFLSTGCGVDPSFAERFPGRTALTAAVAVPWKSFARWEAAAPRAQPAAYAARKDALGRGMLALLARYVPLEAIEHVEVSTPLTTRRYAGHSQGEVYGLAATPLRFRTGPRAPTPIAGLFLTGQDVAMCGFGGAAFGGLVAASAVTRRDLARELAARW